MARIGEQEIKCNVRSCRFNNHARNCTLSDIIVGCDSSGGTAHAKCETECASFEAAVED